MKKKLLAILLCAAMVMALLAGCSKKEEPANNDTQNEKTEDDNKEPEPGNEDEELFIYLVSKGFQHQFWQAVLQGAEEAAADLGVKMEFDGPASESDIQDQVQMLNNAINMSPAAIGLAALDTQACLELIETAMNQGIPIIGFDSGVPDAPDGAIYANASTDNYAAGELAADETYALLEDRIASADGTVRIGVMSQDATSESVTNRGTGFIDKMKELIEATGKTVSVEGHDLWADVVDGADVIIDVAVPAAVTMEASVIDGQNLMNKADTIAIYGSNQHSGEALVNANENLKVLGTEDDQILGIAFDAGELIKGAVRDGVLAGAVTQDPLSIGYNTVALAVAAARGEKVEDVDTGCQWYTADNMDDPKIAPNLYD